MPVFFILPDQVHDGTVTISESPLLNHLRASLRVRVGETLRVGIEGRRRYLLQVTALERKLLRGMILEEEPAPSCTRPRISLGQAILKGDRMDWLIEKSAELGAASVTPLVTARTIARPAPDRAEGQRARWQRIATEAAQQSEQWYIPQILNPLSGKEYFSRDLDGTVNLILMERGPWRTLTAFPLPSESEWLLRIAVGPEGGWSPEEITQAIGYGFSPVSLGARILRAETAALAALSVLQNRLGELG
jgi:16S rRNA (uracil1498-N3)-methyltransferase